MKAFSNVILNTIYNLYPCQNYEGSDPLQLERVSNENPIYLYKYTLADIYERFINKKLNVYFTEVDSPGNSLKYVPRSMQVDLEPGVCNRVWTTS